MVAPRAFVVAALAILLPGCKAFQADSGPPPAHSVTNVEASDRFVVMPTARIGFNFVTPEPRIAPAHAQGGHGVELRMLRARGDDEQIVRTTQRPVVFGDTTFAPPQNLRNEFDFALYEVSYRWRRYFTRYRIIGIEVLGGPAFANLDVTVSSATQSARETRELAGISTTLGVIYRFHRDTSVQHRVGWYSSLRSPDLFAHRWEFFVNYALGRNVALRAGLYNWELQAEESKEDSSKIKLRFSGPLLGLDLMF